MFLRRVVRPLMMMTNVKETAGIVGPDVVPNAREVLIDLYTKTLNEVKAIPEKETYRKTVESSTSHRLKICQEEEDCEKIEKLIGSGQVEQLIDEAKDELRLIGNMNKWKVWGVVDNGAPKPKPVYKAGPLPPEFFQALDSVAIKAEQNRLKKEADEIARKEAEELAKKEAQEAVAAFINAHSDAEPSKEAQEAVAANGNAEPSKEAQEAVAANGNAEPSSSSSYQSSSDDEAPGSSPVAGGHPSF